MMMNEWEGVVQELVSKTKANTLKWKKAEDIEGLRGFAREYMDGHAYVAKHADRQVAIFGYAVPASDDDYGEYTKHGAVIEFVDGRGKLEWRWPVFPLNRDLLEAVRFQVSGAADFLKTVLEK
ncbi:MAG: hypothetical protein ACRELY_16985 [Polyangiaceae bacterium]